MNRILYISLDGAAEPLVQSQVLSYLKKLSKTHDVALFTFEKPEDKEKLISLKEELHEQGICWHYTMYSNRFGLLSSLGLYLKGLCKILMFSRKSRPDIVHARSLFSAMLGFMLKFFFGTKLLFDIRGFWLEEKVESGKLKRKGVLYRALSKIEAFLYKHAGHIVTLTKKSKGILVGSLRVSDAKIDVIPTCVDKALFKPLPKKDSTMLRLELGFKKDEVIILRAGSAKGRYCIKYELMLFKSLKHKLKCKLLLLNKGEHDYIKEEIEKAGLEASDYKLLESSYSEMNQFYNVADFSLFIIPPTPSKAAMAPTRFAEMLACRLPVVVNNGVGDLDYFLSSFPVGLSIDYKALLSGDFENLSEEVVRWFESLKVDEKVFSQLVDRHFDKDVAVNSYSAIYSKLVNGS